MTDDQDTVSKHFLRMHKDSTIISEKFGPAILTIPENIRTQADELFKLSRNNRNEIFDLPNDKVSWILTTTYKKYLDFISQNVSIFCLGIYYNTCFMFIQFTIFLYIIYLINLFT